MSVPLFEIPLLCELRCPDLAGRARDIVIVVRLRLVEGIDLQTTVSWVCTPRPFLAARTGPPMISFTLPGLSVHLPPDVLSSPIYIVATNLATLALVRPLLITVFVNEWHAGDSSTLNVRTHLRYAPDFDVAESRLLPAVRTMDEFIRVQQDQSMNGYVPTTGPTSTLSEGGVSEDDGLQQYVIKKTDMLLPIYVPSTLDSRLKQLLELHNVENARYGLGKVP
ncbi:hypothetical protein VTO73DRAFT_4856 [Trametes versicolor]